MTGKIRLFCTSPSTKLLPAIMALEVNGTNVSITDNCGGVQQFFQLLAQTPALDGEISGAACSGGPAPAGVDECQIGLGSPVDIPPMQKGRVDIGAVSMIVNHTGAYAIRGNSMMMFDLDWRAGQLVLNQSAVNQVGVIFSPRSALPEDTHGPCATQSRVKLPSIVGHSGIGQRLVIFDHSFAPIGQNSFTFTEPNGGGFGVVVIGAGHGFSGNFLEILGAHGQDYGCVDMGHGHNVVGGGNTIRAIVAPNPTTTPAPGTGFDYWGHDDILDLQILPGDAGNGTRGITLEAGSYNLQCRIGQNAAVTPILNGTGHPKPNFINCVAYS